MTARVALIGASGHGAWHRRMIAERQASGQVELVGLADVAEVSQPPPGVPVFRRHEDLLDAVRPEFVVICTPPHTHASIAAAAARAGADVLLEKPPVVSLAEHDELAVVFAAAGRACQVGFQALGSAALARLRQSIVDGCLGPLTGIGVRGAWFRPDTYFRRAAWVGRRELDGRPVVDGALANPFAHAIMQVLAIADAPVSTVEVSRYHATDIEVDDTASLRLRFAPSGDRPGFAAVIAVTLCAETFVAGDITVTGTAGAAVLEYPTDRLRLPGQPELEPVPGRVSLLDNLITHRDAPQTPLIAPLARTRPFTAVLEAILAAPVAALDPAYRQVRDDLPEPRTAIAGVNRAIDAAAANLALFAELAEPAFLKEAP